MASAETFQSEHNVTFAKISNLLLALSINKTSAVTINMISSKNIVRLNGT